MVKAAIVTVLLGLVSGCGSSVKPPEVAAFDEAGEVAKLSPEGRRFYEALKRDAELQRQYEAGTLRFTDADYAGMSQGNPERVELKSDQGNATHKNP